ncbi:alpha/beta fold hydrolase [Spirosoma utsteinense]|uniref:Pimeloyl-ACP methyl ester carboxylesterase n=1 Tax=Spirosoma utsteinense TaxID=2585773 RepID=A0ABR6W4W0_9BACT|nr:alpha/beta hydrolase [Spirosoma utsteinense]MBC3784790.1 pimeloyl-ACP methyl ester carboxylesterase [Spirosoma utsteinense]MBC3791173.1 pimeloyl-ACP methyl ester carboxylesterase [Spirosoma utsteinense]
MNTVVLCNFAAMTEADDLLFFDYEGNRLAYRTIGHGPVTLLAFHGFGQNGHIFSPVDEMIGHQFTILAIDLFFHGSSRYASGHLVTKSDWQRLINAFLAIKRIGRFSVTGFSLGGRFALVTAEAFADRIDQVLLIAPDGITRSKWYELATATRIGRGVFQYGLHHLSTLEQAGHFLVRIGLLNRTVMRFAELSLSTPAQRALVYEVWTQFRLMKPDIHQVAALLNQHSVRTRFFMGAFDRIIPGAFILPLTNRLKHYELTVLNTGHNHLIGLTAERLSR